MVARATPLNRACLAASRRQVLRTSRDRREQFSRPCSRRARQARLASVEWHRAPATSVSIVEKISKLRTASIESFGSQWSRFNELGEVAVGDGADALFRQWIGSFNPDLLRGARVAEIGAGVGRSLYNMSKFEPAELIGYEPSECFSFLEQNMAGIPNCRLENRGGHDFEEKNLDYVLSIGVIHHIPDPLPVIKNVYRSLKSGGQLVFWVYGSQARGYVTLQKILRKVTSRMSDSLLHVICRLFAFLVSGYAALIRILRVRRAPLYEYLVTTFRPLSIEFRKIVIFDQLNPVWSHYYSRQELESLVCSAGFSRPKIEEKGGYSWTVICTR